MTGGKHVTEQMCREIQRYRAQSVPVKAVADDYGITNASVMYHANGRCAHERIDPDLEAPWVNKCPDRTAKCIQQYLRDHPELKKGEYETEDPESLDGHCYVAHEAYYHAKGGSRSGLTPGCLSWGDVPGVESDSTHWFLWQDRNTVIDLTVEATGGVPYHEGRRRAFITGDKPSKRARQVLDALNIALVADVCSESGGGD